MSVANLASLPSNRVQLEKLRSQLGLQGETIHTTTQVIESGSKTKIETCVLLNVIWLADRPAAHIFSSEGRKIWAEKKIFETTAKVRNVKDFLHFLDNVIKGIWPESDAYSVVSAWESVHRMEGTIRNGINWTVVEEPSTPPISSRTRAKLEERNDPTTSTEHPRDEIQAITQDFGDMSLGSPIRIDQSQLEQEPPSPRSPQYSSSKRDSDESIVNFFFITLLMHFGQYMSEKTREWSPERRGFTVTKRDPTTGKDIKIFTAMVDGILRDTTNDEVLAIVEVKPYLRSRGKNKARMQECAEASAWIAVRPPADLEQGRKKGKTFK